MRPGPYNIIVGRREFFELRLQFRNKRTRLPLDISSVTMKAEVRPTDDSDSVTDPVLTLDLAFITDGTDGLVNISKDIGDLEDQVLKWDCFFTYPGTKRKKMLTGTFTIVPSITDS